MADPLVLIIITALVTFVFTLLGMLTQQMITRLGERRQDERVLEMERKRSVLALDMVRAQQLQNAQLESLLELQRLFTQLGRRVDPMKFMFRSRGCNCGCVDRRVILAEPSLRNVDVRKELETCPGHGLDELLREGERSIAVLHNGPLRLYLTGCLDIVGHWEDIKTFHAVPEGEFPLTQLMVAKGISEDAVSVLQSVLQGWELPTLGHSMRRLKANGAMQLAYDPDLGTDSADKFRTSVALENRRRQLTA